MSEAVSSKVTAVDYDPFAATTVARVVPTTEAQRELWLADKLGREASLAFNESVVLSIQGDLDVEALQASLLALSNRHEALRSTLSEDGMSLLIAPEGALHAELVDLRNQSSAEQAATLERMRVEAVERPFDLVNGPLVTAALAQLEERRFELLINSHHVVCDGWSFGVVSRELMLLYQAMVSGIGPQALPAANSFGDFSLALLEPERAQGAEADSRYWVAQYDASVPVLDLPADRSRPAQRTFNSRREDLVVEPELLDAIRKAGAKQGASLFASLFSVFSALSEFSAVNLRSGPALRSN